VRNKERNIDQEKGQYIYIQREATSKTSLESKRALRFKKTRSM
jgi:hypothetical protein